MLPCDWCWKCAPETKRRWQWSERVRQITRGWAGAFHYGPSTRVFGQPQTFVRNRLRRWLWRKDRRTRGLCKFFTDDRLPGQYKLWNWPLPAAWKP